MAFLTLLLALTIVSAVSANNDWSKPCLSGVCEYDLPSSAGSASGTLKIWGSEDSISDITPAAGWEILGCSPDTLEQDIRLVCKEGSSADCAHLYSSSGAEGKIVRLPENCGQGPFAVIAKAWVPEDQSIPDTVASSLMARDGSLPEVKALSLAVDFGGASNDRKAGSPVNFAIRAANVQGANGELDTTTAQRRSMRVMDRGLIDFIKNAITAITSMNDFNVNNTKTLPPFDISKKFNLVNQNVSCPPIDANLKVDVDAAAHAVATIGVVVTGTILPPKIDEFALISNLNAELDGTIVLVGGVTGTLDSGKVKLFEVGIPGLDFPGILTIGPSFQINAQAKAVLDLDVSMTVGINYKVNNAELVFPPPSGSKSTSGGSFTIGDTPLKLSASPNVTANGTVEAHLIPSLNLGVSALGGAANANVFLELDASATLTLGLEGAASGAVTVTPTAPSVKHPKRKETEPIVSRELVQRGATPPGHYYWNRPAPSSASMAAHSSTSAAAPVPSSKSMMAHSSASAATPAASSKAMAIHSSTSVAASAPSNSPKVETEGNASFGGCFAIDAALNVNAGADADFFGLFDKSTSVSLFSKKFELFKKCFGSNVKRSMEDISSRASPSSSFYRFLTRTPRSEAPPFFERGLLDSLLCPAPSTPGALSVADQTIAASAIKTL